MIFILEGRNPCEIPAFISAHLIVVVNDQYQTPSLLQSVRVVPVQWGANLTTVRLYGS